MTFVILRPDIRGWNPPNERVGVTLSSDFGSLKIYKTLRNARRQAGFHTFHYLDKPKELVARTIPGVVCHWRPECLPIVLDDDGKNPIDTITATLHHTSGLPVHVSYENSAHAAVGGIGTAEVDYEEYQLAERQALIWGARAAELKKRIGSGS